VTDRGASPEFSVVPGDRFRAIFDGELVYVWHTLRRLGVREADLKDLCQEVFLTVHHLMDDFDQERPVRPWLFGIAYRIALRYRALARNAREVLGDEPQEVVDPAPSAEEHLAKRDAERLVQAAIASIELRRRAVFVLHELDGQAIPQVADALSIPLNTAYSRLRLAREEFTSAVQRLTARVAP
jgi:RNA polymerase sigma-70 factor, ECF subfamily